MFKRCQVNEMLNKPGTLAAACANCSFHAWPIKLNSLLINRETRVVPVAAGLNWIRLNLDRADWAPHKSLLLTSNRAQRRTHPPTHARTRSDQKYMRKNEADVILFTNCLRVCVSVCVGVCSLQLPHHVTKLSQEHTTLQYEPAGADPSTLCCVLLQVPADCSHSNRACCHNMFVVTTTTVPRRYNPTLIGQGLETVDYFCPM